MDSTKTWMIVKYLEKVNLICQQAILQMGKENQTQVIQEESHRNLLPKLT